MTTTRTLRDSIEEAAADAGVTTQDMIIEHLDRIYRRLGVSPDGETPKGAIGFNERGISKYPHCHCVLLRGQRCDCRNTHPDDTILVVSWNGGTPHLRVRGDSCFPGATSQDVDDPEAVLQALCVQYGPDSSLHYQRLNELGDTIRKAAREWQAVCSRDRPQSSFQQMRAKDAAKDLFAELDRKLESERERLRTAIGDRLATAGHVDAECYRLETSIHNALVAIELEPIDEDLPF